MPTVCGKLLNEVKLDYYSTALNSLANKTKLHIDEQQVATGNFNSHIYIKFVIFSFSLFCFVPPPFIWASVNLPTMFASRQSDEGHLPLATWQLYQQEEELVFGFVFVVFFLSMSMKENNNRNNIKWAAQFDNCLRHQSERVDVYSVYYGHSTIKLHNHTLEI